MEPQTIITMNIVVSLLVATGYAVFAVERPPNDQGKWYENTWAYVALGNVFIWITFLVWTLLVNDGLHPAIKLFFADIIWGLPQVIAQIVKHSKEGKIAKLKQRSLNSELNNIKRKSS